MQTRLPAALRASDTGRLADEILRSCVHCGFCLATCPTYQVTGDELDSPRGRIYLSKQLLEGHVAGAATRAHLDRCLTCRACESTCPSGVRYATLLQIARPLAAEQAPRPLPARLLRRVLRAVLPRPALFGVLVGLGRRVRPLLPDALRRQLSLPTARPALQSWPPPRHARRAVLLTGCVQPVLAPGIDLALARVLDALGVSALRIAAAGCCGALDHHLDAPRAARERARRNIDALWPHVESGVEAVLTSASACTLMLREYAELLREDAVYGPRARRIGELARDPSELLSTEQLRLASCARHGPQADAASPRRVAFQAPCTLQHGLRTRGLVEQLLEAAGFELTSVMDAHLCCGAAGAYSLLQRKLSRQMLAARLRGLTAAAPDVIATANIGCLLQLSAASSVPVRHWVELLAERIAPVAASPAVS